MYVYHDSFLKSILRIVDLSAPSSKSCCLAAQILLIRWDELDLNGDVCQRRHQNKSRKNEQIKFNDIFHTWIVTFRTHGYKHKQISNIRRRLHQFFFIIIKLILRVRLTLELSISFARSFIWILNPFLHLEWVMMTQYNITSTV